MTDTIPDHYKQVLDHGFIGLVDHMGSDASIVRAARVSYQGGTRPVSEDRQLIRYLVRHRHSSPLEMAECVFHVKVPIFVARQWIRHRTASVNEESARYSVIKDEFYVPKPEDIKPQSTSNKQGRDGEFPLYISANIARDMNAVNDMSFTAYENYLERENLSRELARTVLPVATYTSFYWKANLRNILHFLSLRLDPHAQMEIRVYAEAMLEIIKPLFPLTIEAWEDYDFNAVTFSRMEMDMVRRAIAMSDFRLYMDDILEMNGLSKREIAEFMQKLRIRS
jgi:thymidylate synthase (FAD)